MDGLYASPSHFIKLISNELEIAAIYNKALMSVGTTRNIRRNIIYKCSWPCN